VKQVAENSLCTAIGGEPVVNHCNSGVAHQHIFIDCTQTLVSGLNTGVQRVVRNLLPRMRRLAEEKHHNLTVMPVIILDGRIFHAPKLIFDTHSQWEVAGLSQGIPRPLRMRWLQWLRRFFGDPAAALLGGFARRAYFFLRSLGLRSLKGSLVVFQPGDTLVMLDICTDLSLKRPLSRAKRAGVNVIFCHYDLIALTHPHLCSRSWVEAFKRYLSTSIHLADGYLCISKAARHELSLYLTSQRLSRARAIRCQQFSLGSDFVSAGPNSFCGPDEARLGDHMPAAILSPLIEFFNQHDEVIVMVGTIEPRKNHQLSLELLRRIAPERPGLALLWLGRAGWRSKEIIREMRFSNYFPSRLQWFAAASDQEVLYAYHRAAVLLFPSWAEGFGLPIAEAARSGCPVIASDLPCHRELQASAAQFLPPDDVTAWESALRSLLDRSGPFGAPSESKTRTALFSWDDSAEKALQLIRELHVWPRASEL
jgi:glycosyltransferase involved in cell wall biosynthesis